MIDGRLQSRQFISVSCGVFVMVLTIWAMSYIFLSEMHPITVISNRV